MSDPHLFPESVTCPSVSIDGLAGWRVFDHASLPGLTMGQGWVAEGAECRGTVRLARDGGALWVSAMLPDRDIFNPVTEFNREAFTRGDVFEMFLQPEGQGSYFEFHVTPGNQRYQLRFAPDGAGSFRKELSLIPVESATAVFPEAERWEVFARIPLTALVEPAGAPPPERWRVSFCRYDYTRSGNGTTAELFSTSPHRELSFHRRWEWIPLDLIHRSGEGTTPETP